MSAEPLPSHMLHEIVSNLRHADTEAVVLTGSMSRGPAAKLSDVDILAIAPHHDDSLMLLDGRLVSIAWLSKDAVEHSFKNPEQAVWTVPGWRSATILYDPADVAELLQRQALDWLWTPELDNAADRWVAREIVGYCEDAARLLRHMQTGNALGAAALRSVLAIRMAHIMAVHLRVLYDSENDLWALVAGRMPAEWGDLQKRAMGIETHIPDQSARAALRLFVATARQASRLFDHEQREVVNWLCSLVREEFQ